jgi:hypothetical protein
LKNAVLSLVIVCELGHLY